MYMQAFFTRASAKAPEPQMFRKPDVILRTDEKPGLVLHIPAKNNIPVTPVCYRIPVTALLVTSFNSTTAGSLWLIGLLATLLL